MTLRRTSLLPCSKLKITDNKKPRGPCLAGFLEEIRKTKPVFRNVPEDYSMASPKSRLMLASFSRQYAAAGAAMAAPIISPRSSSDCARECPLFCVCMLSCLCFIGRVSLAAVFHSSRKKQNKIEKSFETITGNQKKPRMRGASKTLRNVFNYQMRTRSSGGNHMPSPGLVSKASWNSSMLR